MLVLSRTHSAALSGAAVAGYTLPAMVSGPLLGGWLASAGRRARWALAGNELVLAVVAVGLVLAVGRAPGAVVVLLTLFAGLSLPLTSAGYSSLLPGLVGRAGLARANTLDATTVNGPAVGGPALAGVLSATEGPGVAVLAIGGIAVLATVATCLLPGPVVLPGEAARPALLSVVREGLAHLARTPPLRAATATSVLGYGSFGLLVVAIPTRMAQLGAGTSAAGYLWTTIEVGSVLSILLISRRTQRFAPERVLFVAVSGFGVFLALMAAMPTTAAILVVGAVAGFAEGPNLPSVFAARQRYSPDHLLAQVSTTGASLKIGAYALGSVLSGTLTGVLGPATMLLLAGCGQFVAVAVGLIASGARPRRPSNDPSCSGR